MPVIVGAMLGCLLALLVLQWAPEQRWVGQALRIGYVVAFVVAAIVTHQVADAFATPRAGLLGGMGVTCVVALMLAWPFRWLIAWEARRGQAEARAIAVRDLERRVAALEGRVSGRRVSGRERGRDRITRPFVRP